MAQEDMDIPVMVIESNGGFPTPDEPKIKAHIKGMNHSGNLYFPA